MARQILTWREMVENLFRELCDLVRVRLFITEAATDRMTPRNL